MQPLEPTITEQVTVAATPFAAVLDIETLGQDVTAAIASIGATVINVMTGEEVGHYYTRVEWATGQSERAQEPETLSFWAKQKEESPAAWNEVFDEALSRPSLALALSGLKSFFKALEDLGMELEIVGNGPEFDNVIIDHACKQLGIAPLWQFRRNQSMRTVVWLGRLLRGVDPKYDIPFIGAPHHAGDDSRHEAKVISAAVRALMTVRTYPSNCKAMLTFDRLALYRLVEAERLDMQLPTSFQKSLLIDEGENNGAN
ncbi:MAG: 3'-5' exonuclease [Aeromonas sp.]